VILILVNVFVAILTEAYSTVKSNEASGTPTVHLQMLSDEHRKWFNDHVAKYLTFLRLEDPPAEQTPVRGAARRGAARLGSARLRVSRCLTVRSAQETRLVKQQEKRADTERKFQELQEVRPRAAPRRDCRMRRGARSPSLPRSTTCALACESRAVASRPACPARPCRPTRPAPPWPAPPNDE
jgi:hypothetical protein